MMKIGKNEGDLLHGGGIYFTRKQSTSWPAMAVVLICLTLNEEIADKLHLKQMVQDNQARFGTAFTVSIEARHGVTTGIIPPRQGDNDSCRC